MHFKAQTFMAGFALQKARSAVTVEERSRWRQGFQGGQRLRRETARPELGPGEGGIENAGSGGSFKPAPRIIHWLWAAVSEQRGRAEWLIMTPLFQMQRARPPLLAGRKDGDNEFNLTELIISSFVNSTNISGGSIMC